MMSIIFEQKAIRHLLNKKLKGSITVEAAFSFTLTIFILFMMIGPLLIIKTSSDLLINMNEASKKRCIYELIKYRSKKTRIYEEIEDKLSDTNISKENLKNIENIVNYVANVVSFNTNYDESTREYKNINFVYDKYGGTYDDETGIQKYDYLIEFNLPYNVLRLKNVNERLVITRRAFIGSDGDRFDKNTASGEYIYVAESFINSHRYHTKVDCSYLQKDTAAYDYSEVKNIRNENNEKYTKCDYCFKGVSLNDYTTCYVTKTGDKYHYKDNCPLMTAYINRVPKEYIEIYGLSICPRCEKRESKND